MPITLEQARSLVAEFPRVFRCSEAEYEGLRLGLFNYMVLTQEALMSSAEAINMRGCVFDLDTGELVALPFEKFFNVDEHAGVLEHELVFRGRAYEKLDGSLAQITWYRGRLIVGSRRGLEAYVNAAVSAYLVERPDLVAYLQRFEGVTFLFEYLDPLQPVVIVPDGEELVFLNARCVRSGRYLFAEHAGAIPCRVAESLELTPSVWEGIRAELDVREDTEGYVLWLEEHGFFVKAKTRWYSVNHRIVSRMEPKHFLEAWAGNRVDDVLALLKRLGLSDREEALTAWAAAADAVVWEQVNRALSFLSGFTGGRKELALGLQGLLSTDAVGHAVFGAVMWGWGSGGISGGSVFAAVLESFSGKGRVLTTLVELCRAEAEARLGA